MAQVYFIGGAPRVGKSSLAAKFLAKHPMAFAATDDLRTELRAITDPSEEPDLFYLDTLNANEPNMARLMRDYTDQIIAAADRESTVVWRSVEAFARQYLSSNRDVLIEGVAVLPHLVATLDIPYTAIFLGNQSARHGQILETYADEHPETWLGTLQAPTINAFAKFVQVTSTHVAKAAAAHKLTYLEMSDDQFDERLQQALKALAQVA